MNCFIKTFAITASLVLLSAPVIASAFWPGTVIGIIVATDILKVRQWPASASQIIDAYALQANISLTGRCKNTITNVSFRIDAGGTANWKYLKMKKANVWCQTMTEDAKLGWVRGRYVWPE